MEESVAGSVSSGTASVCLTTFAELLGLSTKGALVAI
jgi:hypothetical protein